MKKLMASGLLALLPAPTFAQVTYQAEFIIHAAPGSNSVPISDWGRQPLVTRTVGTNVTTWTNFTGTINAIPFGNEGVTLTLVFPWASGAATNDWTAMDVHVWGGCEGGAPFNQTVSITMSPGQSSFQQDFWFTPLAGCGIPESPTIHGDVPAVGSYLDFPPNGFWTVSDLFPFGPYNPIYRNPIGIKNIPAEGRGYAGVPGAAFATYSIQSSTNLMTTNWVNVTNITTGADGALNFDWPIVTNAPAMFFRVQLQY